MTETVKNVISSASLLLIALVFLGVAMLMCLGGIIWLSNAVPARPLPDVLIGTTGTIVGAFAPLLVGTVANASRTHSG